MATPTLGYSLGASRFRSDGFRDHSATERTLGNARLRLAPDAQTTLTIVANSVALPRAQDPLGLTRTQWQADPRSVDPSAITFDTRKTVQQTQGGLILERQLGSGHSLRALVYGGHRGTEQFQSIPVATQAGPLHPGGVIALGRDYRGSDLRWTWKTALGGQPFSLVGGLAYDTLDEQRRGYQNFVGPAASATVGVRGALRRDESNRVTASDQYLQAAWQFTPRWSASAGVRHSLVRFASRDAYITASNPDDSGGARYAATTPVLGLLFAASEQLHLYATAGRGFETPTLNELAYRASGATGLNFGLQSSRSRNVEAGIKARLPGWGQVDLALFDTRTSHEIVTQSNVGGRSTFQNAGATTRNGVELSWSASVWQDLRTQFAATVLNARYADGFVTCTATPCAIANVVVPSGNRIPGVARGSAFASANWAPPVGWRGGIEARWVSRVNVNDANSDAAGAYAIASAQLGYVLRTGGLELTAFARGDNLFDRRYAGSVIVNEGNGRFFEPAPGRTWAAGVSGNLRF